MAKKTITGEDGKVYTFKVKKPFYKRVWFWLLVLVVLIIGLSSMGSGSSSSSSSNSSSHKSSGYTVKKNTGKKITLNTGTFKVGRDIKPGRYLVKAASGSGNFTDKSGDINVILGTTADNESGQVDSYTTTLKKGDSIQLSSIQSTTFTPTASKVDYKTNLSAGDWIVGQNIKAGRYAITATAGSGNLSNASGSINEVLGTTADSNAGQVTKVTVNLHNGEVLSSTLEGIKLTKK